MQNEIEFLIEEYNQPDIVGEGGLNSGRTLRSSNPAITGKERQKELVKNAQRTYRNRYRDDYNAQMRKLYKEKYSKDASGEAKQKRLERMRIINANHRLNKKIAQASETGKVKFTPTIGRILKKLLKENPLRVENARQKKSFKGDEKAYNQYIAEFKANKKQEIQEYNLDFLRDEDNRRKARDIELQELLEKRKELLSRHPNLSKELQFKVKDNQRVELNGGDYNYKTPDYSKLTLGSNRLENLTQLNNYYEDVITNPTGEGGDTTYKLFAPNGKNSTYTKKVRELVPIHRSQLNAGEWTLDGSFKKTKGKKFVKEVKKTGDSSSKGAIISQKVKIKENPNPFTPIL